MAMSSGSATASSSLRSRKRWSPISVSVVLTGVPISIWHRFSSRATSGPRQRGGSFDELVGSGNERAGAAVDDQELLLDAHRQGIHGDLSRVQGFRDLSVRVPVAHAVETGGLI